MGEILLTFDEWEAQKYNCPCLDSLNSLCSAKHGQMDKVKCDYDTCPYVFWLNIININK